MDADDLKKAEISWANMAYETILSSDFLQTPVDSGHCPRCGGPFEGEFPRDLPCRCRELDDLFDDLLGPSDEEDDEEL